MNSYTVPPCPLNSSCSRLLPRLPYHCPSALGEPAAASRRILIAAPSVPHINPGSNLVVWRVLYLEFLLLFCHELIPHGVVHTRSFSPERVALEDTVQPTHPPAIEPRAFENKILSHPENFSKVSTVSAFRWHPTLRIHLLPPRPGNTVATRTSAH